MLRAAGADEAREGMQRRQSLIACRDAAGSGLFEVSEKVPDAVGRQIVDDQPVDGDAPRRGDKRDQQGQGIAIAPPRVLREIAFAHQVLQ